MPSTFPLGTPRTPRAATVVPLSLLSLVAAVTLTLGDAPPRAGVVDAEPGVHTPQGQAGRR